MTHRSSRLSWIALGLLVLGLGSVGPARAVIQGTTWFPIGPAPSCCFFPGGEGGRATSVALNPANDAEIWIGTANGGVWRSNNGAATWEPMTDSQASLAIGSVALADCSGSGCVHVYAGTGENSIRRDTYYGRGLLVGTRIDILGTMQWVLRTGTPYNFGRGSIYNVVLDPTTSAESRVIYVSLSSGVTASASESTVTAPEVVVSGNGPALFRSVVDYGLYKSGNDGLTWAKLIVPGTTGYRPTDLEMKPTDHNVLYAGFLERGIFKSVDAGASWCPLNPGFPLPAGCQAATGLPDHASTDFDHVEIAIDPAAADHLYATFGMCPDRLVEDCQPSVYESSNGGQHWDLRYTGTTEGGNPGVCPGAYTRYTHALTVYPAGGGGTVYLGGIRLCKSTDHGQNWTADDTNSYPGPLNTVGTTHFDHHAVAFNSTGAFGYDVNDGGIATWHYPGTTWTPHNETIQAIAFQSIGTSSLTPRVLGGTQDNSGLLWTGAKQWQNTRCCGDGGYSVMDNADPMKMYTTSNTPDLTNIIIVPRRSTDGGTSWYDADWGIPDADPRSFYPPMVQASDPTSLQDPLYFGTNRLFRSTDGADTWSDVSPVLSTIPQTEIFSKVDVISAIAVAPSNPNRIFLGYYSGRVFATDNALSAAPTWYEMTLDLPAAPITWLAVHPTNQDIVYATLSGFFTGMHVYRRNAIVLGHWFAVGGISDLSGVPANTITLEPSNPSILWLGTDKGVYKSTNAGGSWSKFGSGLPNVPVYQIGIDESRQRVFAATHGRGAYLLSGPGLEAYGGCMNNFVWDLTVWGHGFHPQHVCTMKLLRQDSSVCASGMVDASGGSIQSDKDGILATWNVPSWADDPGVWGCLNGKCLGNKSVATCNVPGNPLSTVVAICDNQVAFAQVPGCPSLSGPPSSWVSLTGDLGGFMSPGPQASFDRGAGATAPDAAEAVAALAASVDPAMIGSGSFRLIPTMQAGNGTTRKLCAVTVPYLPGDTITMILERARDAVNVDPICMAAGVSAAIQDAVVDADAEDLFPQPGRLHLLAPGVAGSQLIASVEKQPGPSQGPCFDIGALGVPVQSQLRLMRVGFTTPATGAVGGSLTIKETSPLGECVVSIPTVPGQTADGIATAFESTFQNPGPIQCPATANPHDVKKVAGGLILVMSTGIEVCVEDAGVGMTIAPQETCFGDADCSDGNPCTHDSCDINTGQCQHPPEPEGMPCDDLDLCTFGNFCQQGTCGRPALCDDFNPCTEDACDPLTGICMSTPVECDDGNSCTFDFCDPEMGRCRSFAGPGGTCDDGNACTTGDFCDFQAGGTTPTCRGFDSCDDGNPCTADSCDPITGACTHQATQCDDGNPCTTDLCNLETGSCSFIPTPNAPCDDANACTQDDHCVSNAVGDIACQGTPITCNDQSLCTTDACDPLTGECLHAPISCDDGVGCTQDVCIAATGQCAHTPANCDDNNACTADSCVAPACVVPDNGTGTADLPAQCAYTAQDIFLDQEANGDYLQISSAIHHDFSCPLGSSVVCSFPAPVPGSDCSQAGGTLGGDEGCADSTLRLDLKGFFKGFILYNRTLDLPVSFETHAAPRTLNDPVQSFGTDMFRLFGQIGPADNDPDFDLLRVVAGTDFGMSSPGHMTLTQSGGSWIVDSYYDVTFRIDVVGKATGPLSAWAKSLSWTVRFRTGAGQCVHTAVSCDDGNPCTVDSCDPATGACLHTPLLCDDGDACTIDSCDPQSGACVHTPLTCDDNNLCTVNDHCVPGLTGGTTCQGDPKDCQDGDPCTDDSCVPTDGTCTHTPTGCDDANACTLDSCTPIGCIVPDNGGGTADLPAAACPYRSESPLMILDGFPPGTGIAIDAIQSAFSCPAVPPSNWACTFPSPIPGVDCSQGTPAAGEQACADSSMAMHMVGSGTLAGFTRDIPMSASVEDHLKPRVPGALVQSFDTERFRLYGQLPPGDPDFGLLRLVCGTDFGLPSPGHTTLVKMGGNWGVDSFFDLTCRIDFVGAPGSPLMGRSGSTTGTYRFRTRGGQCLHTPVDCDDGNACTIDSCDPALGTCSHAPVSCDDGNACTVDSCDPVGGCMHQVPAIAEPSPTLFQSAITASWPVSPGATHWNTYRGTIPATMLGSRLPGSVYDQSCFESADAFGDGATQTTDRANPPLGSGFYYLMSAEGDCAESPIGHASSGAAVPNTLACPTPP